MSKKCSSSLLVSNNIYIYGQMLYLVYLHYNLLVDSSLGGSCSQLSLVSLSHSAPSLESFIKVSLLTIIDL